MHNAYVSVHALLETTAPDCSPINTLSALPTLLVLQ